ncbi:MAG: site-specific integrase [Pseudomonadota bacterium]
MDRRTRTGKANATPGVTERRGRCLISYTVKGRRQQKLTHWPFPGGIDHALKERNRLIREQGSVRQVPLFKTLAQERLDSANLTPASRRTAKSRLNNYWSGLGGRYVDEITYRDIAQVMAGTNHLAPKTRRHILSEGHKVLEVARRSGFIDTNPASQFDEIRGDSGEVDPFTMRERDALLAKLSGNAKLFYLIRFYCGLRPGEVLGLTWSDYDGKQFHVHQQTVEGAHRDTTKTHKPRLVHVHPKVRDALSLWPTRFQRGHILITKDGEPYRRPESLAESLNLAMKKAEVRYRSPYNARHTCATMMLEAGMEPAYCAGQLGHSIEMFLRIYATWVNSDRSEQQAKIWGSIQ